MTTLAEFLLARIAEDEAMLGEGFYSEARLYAQTEPERWRAECEAKRRIVAHHTGGDPWEEYDPNAPCHTLRLLALPYADHPDFQEQWRV